jgi:hypothetical protein
MKYVHRCPKLMNLTYVCRFSTSLMNVYRTWVCRSCHVTDEFRPRKFVVDVAWPTNVRGKALSDTTLICSSVMRWSDKCTVLQFRNHALSFSFFLPPQPYLSSSAISLSLNTSPLPPNLFLVIIAAADRRHPVPSLLPPNLAPDAGSQCCPGHQRWPIGHLPPTPA